MKTNTFLTIISIVLAALVGYLAFHVASGKENDIVCGMYSTICFAATLVPAMGLEYESGRLGANIRVFSGVFFAFFVVSHFFFAGFGVKLPYYIIVNGIMLVIYLAIFYKMKGIDDI